MHVRPFLLQPRGAARLGEVGLRVHHGQTVAREVLMRDHVIAEDLARWRDAAVVMHQVFVRDVVVVAHDAVRLACDSPGTSDIRRASCRYRADIRTCWTSTWWPYVRSSERNRFSLYTSRVLLAAGLSG